MTLPGLRRRSSLGQHPDCWSDMLRGAVAVLVLGTVVSALVAHGWQQTIDRQREERWTARPTRER